MSADCHGVVGILGGGTFEGAVDVVAETFCESASDDDGCGIGWSAAKVSPRASSAS